MFSKTFIVNTIWFFTKYIILIVFLAFILVPTSFVSTINSSQNKVKLQPNQPTSLLIGIEEQKSFILNLKQEEYVEIVFLANEGLDLSFVLYDPVGKDVLVGNIDESISFIAEETGEYILVVKLNKSQKLTGFHKVTLQYSNELSLPSKVSYMDFRNLNGYSIKIFNSFEKQEPSIFFIEKNGKKKIVLKDYGSFHFCDDIKSYSFVTVDTKRSARLMKATLDKTGDGVPDIAIGYYSGGAHCCFTTLFFELGEIIKAIEPIDTGHANILAIGKNPRGGLLLETVDTTFAYWLASFGNSPFPKVILEFHKGVLRPNLRLMKKSAPSLSMLNKQAKEVKGLMNLSSYEGESKSGNLEVVFWDVMLDLIYSGHEELAYQYLDLVWPLEKSGKSLFLADFKKHLALSEFWQMMKTKEIEKAAKPVETASNTNSSNVGSSSAGAVEPDPAVDKRMTGEFVRIPAGNFTMGSTNGENDEKPVHDVVISRSFEMGKYEVTQEQWEAVMGNNPSYFKGDGRLPVERVSWEDVQQFISALNSRSRKYIYRLPTEAEWEYAARAGSRGDYAGNLDAMAWYGSNSGSKTHSVGGKQPNAFGLYDMHGNVYEWCSDWYGNYSSGTVTDPSGASSGSYRVFRGGGCGSDAALCRLADRNISTPDNRGNYLGFRLLRTVRSVP